MIHNGKEALYTLIFNDDDTISGFVLTYSDVSRKEYNARVTELEEKYGAPYNEYGDATGSSKAFINADTKTKEGFAVVIVYLNEEKSVVETFAYVYGSDPSGVRA
ncbi:MAG: hypothetical protein NC084_10475 [Bacteroides sp.]|nr:hypothetical protein [Eubacterium sp.]MCM1418984.1 hypothetical protein [Roseburia sp.]MCM1463122.1 hypothetical protein [Bacteroides sp.]